MTIRVKNIYLLHEHFLTIDNVHAALQLVHLLTCEIEYLSLVIVNRQLSIVNCFDASLNTINHQLDRSDCGRKIEVGTHTLQVSICT